MLEQLRLTLTAPAEFAARFGSSIRGTRTFAAGPTVRSIAAGSRIHAIRPRAVRSSSSNWNACDCAPDSYRRGVHAGGELAAVAPLPGGWTEAT